eukprot:c14859_g1_i1 orf=79-825(-)
MMFFSNKLMRRCLISPCLVWLKLFNHGNNQKPCSFMPLNTRSGIEASICRDPRAPKTITVLPSLTQLTAVLVILPPTQSIAECTISPFVAFFTFSTTSSNVELITTSAPRALSSFTWLLRLTTLIVCPRINKKLCGDLIRQRRGDGYDIIRTYHNVLLPHPLFVAHRKHTLPNFNVAYVFSNLIDGAHAFEAGNGGEGGGVPTAVGSTNGIHIGRVNTSAQHLYHHLPSWRGRGLGLLHNFTSLPWLN